MISKIGVTNEWCLGFEAGAVARRPQRFRQMDFEGEDEVDDEKEKDEDDATQA